MSTEEIKAEINRVLDNLPDKALQNLLDYLQNINIKKDAILDMSTLEKILLEDENLLAKLAK